MGTSSRAEIRPPSALLATRSWPYVLRPTVGQCERSKGDAPRRREATGRRFAFAVTLMMALVSHAVAQPRHTESALYREVPFQDLGRPPVGAPVSSGPVIGLREDQIRVNARYTGKSRESTKQDTRLRDAWTLSKRFARPGEKLRWLEFEFTDGMRSAWLPVLPFVVPTFLGAKADDEFELFVHRVDAPPAAPEITGSESVVMNAARGPVASIAASRVTVLHDGGLFFDYSGSRFGIDLKPGGASAVMMGAHPEQASAFVLDLANPDGSLARIEVVGLNGPGTYAPKSLAIALPAGRGGPNTLNEAGCKVMVATANPWEVAGSIECPAEEHRPARAEFRVRAR